MTTTQASGPTTELSTLLQVAEIDVDRYLAPGRPSNGAGLYGGQVAAQALMAAAATVSDDRTPHSLHGYFLRRGRPEDPITYEVQRERDGRSYSMRRVVARQEGGIVFTLDTSFQVPEEGEDVQASSLPDVAGPEDSELVETHLAGVEIRDPAPDPDRDHPTRVWARCPGLTSDDQTLHAAAFTYVSDLFSGLPGFVDVRPTDLMTSLDHAVWFHRPLRTDSWLLFDHVAASLASNRGWYTGSAHDQRGVLVASLAQEMVHRRRTLRT